MRCRVNLRIALVLDKSGTILKPCRIAFDLKSGRLLYHISTLKLVKEVNGYLLNIEGDLKKIEEKKQKPIFKISCAFSKALPKINEDIIMRKEVLMALKEVESLAYKHCGSEIGTCIALILNEYREPIYSVGLGGKIYSDLKKILNEIKNVSDLFIATGNCKKATLNCAKKLKIDKRFVLYNASPKDKMEFVKKLKAFYSCVIMVGNDINDLMAMKVADVSIFINREKESLPYEVDYIIESLVDLPKIIFELSNFKTS